MLRTPLLLLTPLIFLLLACGAAATMTPGPTATPNPVPSPTPDRWEPVGEATWQDRVRLTLWVKGEQITPADTWGARVVVENLSDQDVEYTLWNIGDPAVYMGLRHPFQHPHGDLGPVTLRAPGEPEVVLPAVTFETLGPGETITRSVSWDVTLLSGAESIMAPNGVYTLEVTFFPGQHTDVPTDVPTERLTLEREIEVVGSRHLLSPDSAMQRVLELPSVQRWLDAHTGEAVLREEKGMRLVNLEGEWTEVDQQYYQQVEEGELLGQVIRLDHWDWKVRFSTRLGFAPWEMEVIIDGGTGEVAQVSPDLLAQLEGGVVATFRVTDFTFHVFVFDTNPDTIEELYRLQAGESTANIPNGRLLRGPGAGMHNTPWSWHLDPQDVEMAEFTIELCDGEPSFVESELEYWLETVQRYCPWSAELVEIQDYR